MSEPPLDAGDDAATPLEPDERVQLTPTYITTRAQLNEAEQIGIAEADEWAFRRKRDVLHERFLLGLHKRMLGNVWAGGGHPHDRAQYRRRGAQDWGRTAHVVR